MLMESWANNENNIFLILERMVALSTAKASRDSGVVILFTYIMRKMFHLYRSFSMNYSKQLPCIWEDN